MMGKYLSDVVYEAAKAEKEKRRREMGYADDDFIAPRRKVTFDEARKAFPPDFATQAAERVRKAKEARKKKVTNWQPIETAPKDGTTILLAITSAEVI